MKHKSVSSPQGEQNVESNSYIVRVPAGSYTLTAEDEARLQALAARPDSEIDFSDIPRLTQEEYAEAKRMIAQRRSASLPKAS